MKPPFASVLPALAIVAATACSPSTPTAVIPPATRTLPASQDCHPARDRAPLLSSIDWSPGGTPEIDVAQVHDHRCGARIVDVRERDELLGPLGHVVASEWVPLRNLARVSERWGHDDPIVLVCRSGRRSGRAASYLTELGFEHVASMTGGMLAWKRAGFEASRAEDFAGAAEERPRPAPTSAGPVTVDDIVIHLGDPDQVRWTKAATLLLHGTESCVDGRDAHAVVGTPGGDAGELLLALATVEHTTEHPLEAGDVASILDGYVSAFGHFYMHTDEHALHELGDTLRGDTAFKGVNLTTPSDVEALLRHPPARVRPALLEHLLDADHIGCGHLKLIRQYPDDYRVRPALLEAFFRAYYERLWTGNDELELVVLWGEHAEAAVLQVVLDHAVHPFTRIPMVTPRHLGRELFVNHPQVAAFVREQNTAFLLERIPWLAERGVASDTFTASLAELASHQLTLTVGHLAGGLPVYEATFAAGDDAPTVRKVDGGP